MDMIQYKPIKQNKMTNQLYQTTHKRHYKQTNKMGHDILVNKDITVTLSPVDVSKLINNNTDVLTPRVMRTLTVFQLHQTQTGWNNSEMKMLIDDYMSLLGQKNTKQNKKQVILSLKEDMQKLTRIGIIQLKKNGDFRHLSIYGGFYEVKNGMITFTFSNVYTKYQKYSNFMYISKQVLQINPLYNPNSLYLYRKISVHKVMNRGKHNEDRISVKSLLDCCPDIPQYNEIKGTGEIKRKILNRFQRDLDVLNRTFSYRYIKQGKPLTEQQISNMNYNFFSSLIIEVSWRDYPENKSKRGSYLT